MLTLSKLELNGFGLNKSVLKSILDTLKTQISIVEKKAFSLAGRNFNFASSVDVAKVIGRCKVSYHYEVVDVFFRNVQRQESEY